MNEILADKLTDLEECIARIREDWERPSGVPFEQDRVKRQLVILNLQLAFQNLLDMANHLVRARKSGWPKDNAETFELLEQADLITPEAGSGTQTYYISVSANTGNPGADRLMGGGVNTNRPSPARRPVLYCPGTAAPGHTPPA